MSSEEEDACPPSPSLHRSREVCSSFQWTAALPPPARSFKARVVSVEAGGLLFLQLSGLRSQYKELSARMEKVLGSSQPDCGRESFLPRQPVMARWWDGVWYRAVFWAYTLHSGHTAQATVTFVDFGNTDCVAVTDLRSRLVGTGLPIFALSAVLGGVAPVGGEWSPGTLDFLAATLCDTPASLRVRLLAGGRARDRPLQVALELPPSGPGLPWVQVTDLLLLQGGCVRSPQGEEARERGTMATPPPLPVSPNYGVEAEVLGEVAITALQDLVPGEVFSCSFLRLAAWDTALVRLEPGQGGDRKAVQELCCYQEMTAELGVMCPLLPPLLGGGESLEPGHLVAVARRGGWARARLLGGGRLALPDWGLEEEVRDTRFLRELPARWEGVP